MVATFCIVLLLAVDYLAGGLLRNFVRVGSVGVFQLGDSAATAVLESGIFSTRKRLAEQNRILTDRVSHLQEKEFLYDALKAENESLKAFLKFSDASTSSQRGVVASIVSSLRSSPYGTFLVGVGSADGVTTGSYVLTEEGVVIGIVKDVGPHVSTAAEIFAPGVQEEGVVEGAVVLIDGSGAGNGYGKVPRGLNVQIGDPVISPRLGSRVIGVVGAIASSSASASQDVFIRIPINFATIRYVYILPANN